MTKTTTVRPAVLITGVSTGIGFSIAEELLGRGYTVFGSVRKLSDAAALQALDKKQQFIPLLFDVCDEPAIAQAVATVRGHLPAGTGLHCLINNAAIAIGGPLLHQPMEEIRKHFEVNVMGMLAVTKAFAPLLGAVRDCPHPAGKIINISSVGGRIVFPFMGAYHGTKFAMEGLSSVLRRELLLYGIDVIVIGPGAVNTPIWDKGTKSDQYDQTDYKDILERFSKYVVKNGKAGDTPEHVARRVVDIMEKKRPKTRYAIVKHWFTNWVMPRILPDRTLDKWIGKATGLLKRGR